VNIGGRRAGAPTIGVVALLLSGLDRQQPGGVPMSDSTRLAALEREIAELRAELVESRAGAGGAGGAGRAGGGEGLSRRQLVQGGGLGLLGVAGAAFVAGAGAGPAAADVGAAPGASALLVPPEPPTTFQKAFFMSDPWIDVKADFDDGGAAPAVGNGVADDTAAFERALTIAGGTPGGAMIFVPQGTYLITRTLKVPNNTHIVGVGGGRGLASSPGTSELRASGSLVGPVIQNLDTVNGNRNISLRRLRILGAVANPANGAAVSFIRTSGAANDTIVIDECTVLRGGRAAIELRAGGSQISRCTIGGNGLVTVGIIVDWADSIIWGNQITTGATPTVTGGPGIQLKPFADHNIISNNFVFWCENGVVVDNARRNVISANRIDMNMDDGLLIKSDARFNTVSGNVFHGNGMRATNTHAAGVNLSGNSRYNAVTGNTSTKFDAFTPPTGGQHQPHGIRLTGTTHHNVVTGNAFADNVLAGIFTDATIGANAVHGNVIDTDDTFRVVGGSAVLDELAATPGAPAAGTQAKVYVKGDKLIVAFNEGAGTVRYKSLPLSGTGVTWSQSTTAP
jgi:parallel beta-helix repeat protein